MSRPSGPDSAAAPGKQGDPPRARALLGIDVGGTFTDAVLVHHGSLFRAKLPTTADQSAGVLEAARRVLKSAGLAAGEVDYFAHGMTTATNALLERKGAATAAVTTEGFRDILEIGRQNRPRLYDLCPQRPEPLVPADLRLTADERVTPDGVERGLSGEEAARVAARIGELQPGAVAICLLFSFIEPAHERMLAEEIARAHPHIHVSLSSEVLPQFREYERFSTTAVDAYLTPVVAAYLERLGGRASEAGLPAPVIMQSSGGVLPLVKAAVSAAPLLLSGPAAGVVGCSHAGERSQVDNLIAFDMGGTSTDVTLIRQGRAETTTEREIGGCPVALPMVDIHTIGAGGGSIAWIDAGGALRVGPESAGAEPGPAAYGHGGRLPTVTDANLCLGYLGERLGGAGGFALDQAAAREAVGRLAAELGLSVEEACLGIRRIANAGMVKALRVISVEKGHDPRRFALVAFGGAGPMHGADLAAELDVGRVLVPVSCGVLSALGMVVGDQRRDWVQTVYHAGGADVAEIEAAFTRLGESAQAELACADFAFAADMRYRGQSHELTVPVDIPLDIASASAAFERRHEQLYGYLAEGEQVELVNIRLTASISPERLELGMGGASAVAAGEEASGGRGGLTGEQAVPRPATRKGYFEGRWLETQIWQRGDIAVGAAATGAGFITGPAVIEEDEATTIVPPGWSAAVDDVGNLWLERES